MDKLCKSEKNWRKKLYNYLKNFANYSTGCDRSHTGTHIMCYCGFYVSRRLLILHVVSKKHRERMEQLYGESTTDIPCPYESWVFGLKPKIPEEQILEILKRNVVGRCGCVPEKQLENTKHPPFPYERTKESVELLNHLKRCTDEVVLK